MDYYYEIDDNECLIISEYAEMSPDGQSCYGVHRNVLATITRKAFVAMFEQWIMHPAVDATREEYERER